MNMITPFSGLSLIVHILIIGIATIVKSIFKKGGRSFHMPAKVSGIWLKYREIVLPVFSISIVLVVISIVSISTTIAMKTGIREGARESHLEFINKKYALLQDMHKTIANSNFTRPSALSKMSEAESHLVIGYESDIFRPITKKLSSTPKLPLQTDFDNLIIGNNNFQLKLYEK